MTSTNGRGPKRAILYTRVSGEEQAKKGYSLPDQCETLRRWAECEGYEILEEVADEGWSGAYLERPGLDRVRYLVQEGGVSAVVVLFRDRLARGVYTQLLKEEFAERGTRMIALNVQMDDSPEGELQGGILDQFAAYERAKIAERTRRGRQRKAREGRIIASWKAPFGFRYNEARDGLVVDESEMAIVERIFQLACEGLGSRAMQSRLYSEGVPTPTGRQVWAQPVLRRLIFNDVYKPYRYTEIETMISMQVATGLDHSKEYGVWWWNRQRVKQRTVSEDDGNGERQYRKLTTSTSRPEEEWIAVPAPAYLNRRLVDQARAMLENHKGFERKHRAREWELRGLVRCVCGWQMRTHTANGKGGVRYFYYNCRRRQNYGPSACNQKSLRAAEVEGAVWSFVSGLLLDPEKVQTGMEELIERERAAAELQTGNPEREAEMWLEKISEADRKRNGFQDMAAEGLITFDELREKLAGLEDIRRTAQKELDTLSRRREKVEELEHDRDALLASYVGVVKHTLAGLTGEERNKVYRMLRLQVTPTCGSYEVRGAFCTSKPMS